MLLAVYYGPIDIISYGRVILKSDSNMSDLHSSGRSNERIVNYVMI